MESYLAHRLTHGGASLLNELYNAANTTRFNRVDQTAKRPMFLRRLFYKHAGRGRCELCGKRLTALAAKPVRMSAFPTEFTPQPQQLLVLVERKKIQESLAKVAARDRPWARRIRPS